MQASRSEASITFSRLPPKAPTYHLRPRTGRPGTVLVLTARTPCPPLPPTLADPVAQVLLFDPGAASPTSSGNIATVEFPLTPDGLWAGTLRVPKTASVGSDQVHVQCVARTSTGERKTYFEYAASIPLTIKAKK